MTRPIPTGADATTPNMYAAICYVVWGCAERPTLVSNDQERPDPFSRPGRAVYPVCPTHRRQRLDEVAVGTRKSASFRAFTPAEKARIDAYWDYVEPSPPPADIVLQSRIGPDKVPNAVVRVVDGQSLQFVNWSDYRGWEVRRIATMESEDDLRVGWVSNTESPGEVKARYRNGNVAAKRFQRVDEAVRHILQWAS